MREMVKLLYSFGYALRGVGHGIATQRNLRIHITAVIVVVTFNFMAQMSAEHWCIEILCCMIVISLELVNTSVESLCNRVSTQRHPLIGHAKDAAAGAVLMSAIGAIVIAFIIFFLGDPSYQINVSKLLEIKQIKCLIFVETLVALVFIFLPSVLQKHKER